MVKDLMFQLQMWITVEKDMLKRKILVEAYNQLGTLKEEASKPRHVTEDAVNLTETPAIPFVDGARRSDKL